MEWTNLTLSTILKRPRWCLQLSGSSNFKSTFLGLKHTRLLSATSKMAESSKKRVCMIGSGNWGSAIAKIVGPNVKRHAMFEETVKMYTHEEMVNGRKLTEIINTDHENVKYLPGYKLPENVIAVPDLTESISDADVIIFNMPHQFVVPMCSQMKGSLKKGATGISLIKNDLLLLNRQIADAQGLSHTSVGLKQMSEVIEDCLGLQCGVLMGANLANEVADEKFTEATIGCNDKSQWEMWKNLFHCDYFKVKCVEDEHTVELCGALKNIVATGAGVIDGLGYGENTKAAIIRLGMVEMMLFARTFYDKVLDSTFLESCGIADLIATCYGGRNRRVAEAFVKTGKSIFELEEEMLNGQKLQGPHTAYQVYLLLKDKKMEDQFPLMIAIYRIFYENEPPSYLIETLSEHF
ncbi:glycerol-3-phosphate dehydrogenase [NAD(+)], cytoplasmic-like isoform X1 [Rhopilema esculentum]|uniref:glycerol-3-phosphate dehydrogenase [NAD(+)], cytoplasmic-like isoform X1 n=1 Tax=Rhopilema esculentum TaxID=499914 RepID=UPI0031E06B3B